MDSPNVKLDNLAFRLWLDALEKHSNLANKTVVSVSPIPSFEELSDNQGQEETKFRNKWKIQQFMEWILYHPWYGWYQNLKKSCSTSEWKLLKFFFKTNI